MAANIHYNSENNSKKLTCFAGRGRYTYETIDLSSTGSLGDIGDLESRVTILEQEFANMIAITLDEIAQLFN